LEPVFLSHKFAGFDFTLQPAHVGNLSGNLSGYPIADITPDRLSVDTT
jgi:hypothetical protein